MGKGSAIRVGSAKFSISYPKSSCIKSIKYSYVKGESVSGQKFLRCCKPIISFGSMQARVVQRKVGGDLWKNSASTLFYLGYWREEMKLGDNITWENKFFLDFLTNLADVWELVKIKWIKTRVKYIN